MDGVVLFVDDKIDSLVAENSEIIREPENELFEALRVKYPVLGIKNLDLAKAVVNSIGSFTAIILDWIFEDVDDLLFEGEDVELLKGVRAPRRDFEKTYEFLRQNDFYSLIYVYSNESIEDQFGDDLKARFPGRIIFQRKGELKNPAEDIVKAIENWKDQNKNLSIPLAWSASINQSMQQIFKDLSTAHRDWLREIYQSASRDHGHPELFVVEIFQSLLSENLVQAESLLEAIREFGNAMPDNDDQNEKKEESVALLFNRLFYSKLHRSTPIMTGDICQTGRSEFAIIVSPECNIGSICNSGGSFDILKFSLGSFDEYLKRTFSFKKSQFANLANGSSKEKKKLEKILNDAFNQKIDKYHVLPSFPINGEINKSVVIDFSNGISRITHKKLVNLKRTYKLNTIFLQQLRQRFLAYTGRIGVPTLPEALRNFNLRP